MYLLSGIPQAIAEGLSTMSGVAPPGVAVIHHGFDLVMHDLRWISLSFPLDHCSASSVMLVLISVDSVVLRHLSESAFSLDASGLPLLSEFLKSPLKVFPDFLIGLVWAISPKVKCLLVILW